MVTKAKTGKKSTKRRYKAFAAAILGKSSGVIQPRVQAVGPERFGIVSVDCAKVRSKWILCDFYGKLLIPPTHVEHRRSDLQMMVLTIKQAITSHSIQDLIACVEMTGTSPDLVSTFYMASARDAGSIVREFHVSYTT